METTAPSVPSWLNLDILAPPEVRADVQRVTQRLRAIMPELRELASDARAVMARAEVPENAAIEGLPDGIDNDASDGVSLLCRELTGSQPLYQLLQEAADLIHPETICAPQPVTEGL